MSQQQTATDFVASLIRTAVPGLAGLILSWLATADLPIHVQGLTQGDVQTALAAALGFLWYLIVRALETKWPSLGVFLGVPKQPSYVPPAVSVGVASDGKPSFIVAAPSFTADELAGPEVEQAPDANAVTPGVIEPAPVAAAVGVPAPADTTPAA